MPNWCSTVYHLIGNKTDLKKLYKLMDGLDNLPQPSIPNGFGTSWLGCLVSALGGDIEKVHCRGEYSGLELKGDVLTFTTETAWTPCNEVLDLIAESFPSIQYYFMAEESGQELYMTNDRNGVFFPERFLVQTDSQDVGWIEEYFVTEKAAFKWISKTFGTKIKNADDLEKLNKKLSKKDEDAYICVLEIGIV